MRHVQKMSHLDTQELRSSAWGLGGEESVHSSTGNWETEAFSIAGVSRLVCFRKRILWVVQETLDRKVGNGRNITEVATAVVLCKRQ